MVDASGHDNPLLVFFANNVCLDEGTAGGSLKNTCILETFNEGICELVQFHSWATLFVGVWRASRDPLTDRFVGRHSSWQFAKDFYPFFRQVCFQFLAGIVRKK